jgi:hypothetical protein
VAVRCSRGRLRASDRIMSRLVAGSFCAQLLGWRPPAVAGVRASGLWSCREPPDVGAGILRSSGCRRRRYPIRGALLCWRAGLPYGFPGRGCRAAFRLGRSILVRLRLRVLPLVGRSLLVARHAPVPPNRVRWVGTPNWVDSRFSWVAPGCGIADRRLQRLIHRRRFTVLRWSRDGTAPAPLARG